METTERVIAKNTAMLMLMSLSKLLLPLVTFPFLTRVLSIEMYGKITYVKSCITYIQIILDFGFMYSATKQIVEHRNDVIAMSKIVASVTEAKLLLGMVSIGVIFVMLCRIELLRGFSIYMLLAFVAALINSIIPDYLFRGINQMHIITYRFVACKSLSTVLTILLIHGDQTVLFIPILDCLSSLIAAFATYVCVKKYSIRICLVPLKQALNSIHSGFVYFFSNFASTAFNAFLTIVIGVYLNAVDVAYWGVSLQLILAAQALYTPIGDGIYPKMIETKDARIVKKVLIVMMPIIIIATIIAYLFANELLTLVGGEKYSLATSTFRALLPLLVFSFPTLILGWPTLGAIGKEKLNTYSTVIGATVQVVMVLVLILCKAFTLKTLVITRVVAEVMLFVLRLVFCISNRNEFMMARIQ